MSFQEAFLAQIEETKERNPSFTDEDAWYCSGRATKALPNKKDRAWWEANGPEMVQRFKDWRETVGWPLVEVGNQPAIELEYNFTLPNDILVKAYIDRIYWLPNGEACVVDIKTGQMPDHTAQLGVYATACEIVDGIRPPWGCFWDAQKGTHTDPQPLDMWTPALLGQMFKEFIDGVNAGAFLPRPNNGCPRWCGVADFCHVVGGQKAKGVDPLAELDILQIGDQQ